MTLAGEGGVWQMLTLADKGGRGSDKWWQHWKTCFKGANKNLQTYSKILVIYTNYCTVLVFFGHLGRCGKEFAEQADNTRGGGG